MTTSPEPDDQAIHEFFGLSYCTHLVLPRVLLQSMPGDWQARFVRLLRDYDDAVRDVPQPSRYQVGAAEQHEADCLTETQMRLAGVAREWVGDDEDGAFQYYDRDANEIEPDTRVLVPVADPPPHYDRGRTIIPLKRRGEVTPTSDQPEEGKR